MRRKKGEDAVPATSGDGRVTPAEVQQVEFRLSFRGYNERDVDAFLDRITEDLSTYLDELERLRVGMPAAPLTSSNGAAEADAIVARAREQAAAIVRQAEQRAAAIVAGGGAGAGGDTRTVVAPFLNTEREFLQSLGGLVQGHAEEIKRMVLALRSREDTAAPAAPAPVSRPAEPTPTVTSTPPPPAPARESETGASASEIRERLGEPDPAASAPSAVRVSDLDDPIVLEGSTEPAYSSEGAPAGEGRERSLRELFWGED
jgi:DivIVA domain-containing protein